MILENSWETFPNRPGHLRGELTFTGLCCESFYSRKAASSSHLSPPEDRLVEDRVRVNCSASFWLICVIWLSWERPGLWADPARVTSFGSFTQIHSHILFPPPPRRFVFLLSQTCSESTGLLFFLSCFFWTADTHHTPSIWQKAAIDCRAKKKINTVTFNTHFLQTRDGTIYDFIADRDRKTLRESWSSWISILGIKAVAVWDFHYRSWPNTITIVI